MPTIDEDIAAQEKRNGRELIDWNTYDWFIWLWHGVARDYIADIMMQAADGTGPPFADDEDRSQIRALFDEMVAGGERPAWMTWPASKGAR